MDKRYVTLRARLEELSIRELERIKKNIDITCNDTYNYDKETNTFCPLAVALNLHKTMENPSEEKVIEVLSKRFNPVSVLTDVEGEYYKHDRKKDLLQTVEWVLEDKRRAATQASNMNDVCQCGRIYCDHEYKY